MTGAMGMAMVLLIVLLAGTGALIAAAGRIGQQRAWARAEAAADLDARLEAAMRRDVARNLARLREVIR